MVDSEQYFIAANLGCQQQFTVLLAFETGPFSAVSLVVGKTVPEIHWETFIQQNFHAILSSSDSCAS